MSEYEHKKEKEDALEIYKVTKKLAFKSTKLFLS
jgi:hypothetical protein